MKVKILSVLVLILLLFSCDYDVIDPDPVIPAITFRKTNPADKNLIPTKIIRGHDGKYVISGSQGDPVQGFVTMVDSIGNSVSDFPIIYPSPSLITDIVKTNSGYAFIGDIFVNNVLVSTLALYSKDFDWIKTTTFNNGVQAPLVFDVIKTSSGLAVSGNFYINSTWNRFFAKTNLNGDIIVSPKTFDLLGNQGLTAMESLDGNNYLAIGANDLKSTNIMLTFINQNGNEFNNSPKYIENNQISFAYGMAKYSKGYAILGKYDDAFKRTECFLVLCDKNGNKLSSSLEHLGVYADGSNFYSSGIINTAEGGFALVGQSASNNIVLLIFDNNGIQLSNSPIEYAHSGIQNAQDVIQTEDGGFAIVGTTNEHGNDELLILKTDKDGKINN